jgi:CelD/BcsL family acetyltransferase involved in cellulose biosynthesis
MAISDTILPMPMASPGTVLLYHALERVSREKRFRYFDFTQGEGQAKEIFGRASFLQADIYFFRWTLKNAVAIYGHAAMDWCSSGLGRAADALGVRQRLRKLIRRSG